MFLSRPCYRKLRAYVDQGKRIWTDHPLKFIHDWYHVPQTTSWAARPPTPLASKRFDLPPQDLGVPHQLASSSAAGKVTHTVSQDTAKLWTDALKLKLFSQP